MNRLQVLIKSVVDNIGEEITPDERKKMEEALVKIFVEHETPKEALGFSDEMMEHMYAYGYRLFNNGNYKRAGEVFIGLCTYNPKESRYVLGAGAAFHKQKNYLKACEYYLTAGILDTQDPLPFYYLYDCYNQAGILSDAQGCLEIAIHRMGDNPKFSKLKARAVLLLDGLKNYINQLEKEGQLITVDSLLEETNVEVTKEAPAEPLKEEIPKR